MTRHLVRCDPFELPTLDRFITRVFNDPFLAVRPSAPGMTQTIDEGSLALDISENDKDVIVRASLPGFGKEQVDVEVHDGVLTIKAERAEEHEESGEQFHRKERRFGALHRRVTLPNSVTEDNATAELKDGVLTLRLPKAVKATGRKVKVNN